MNYLPELNFEHISLISAADVHRRVFSGTETKVDDANMFVGMGKSALANGWNIDKHGKIMQMYCGDSSDESTEGFNYRERLKSIRYKRTTFPRKLKNYFQIQASRF